METYKIIQPPKENIRFPENLKWKPSIIDYKSHQAYKDFFQGNSNAGNLKNTTSFVYYFIANLLKRIVKYELIPLHLRKPKSISGYISFLSLSFKNAFGLHSKTYRRAGAIGINSEIDSEMQKNGVAVISIPENRFNEVSNVASISFDKLREKRNNKLNGDRDFEESRSYARRDAMGGLFEVVESLLHESGIIAAASSYLKRDARLIDINPQINDVTDNFWIKIFTDVENLEFPQTAYFHRDASGGDLKAIIYLSDVGDMNGPFSYALGSHKMSMSRLDDFICETNDSSGYSSTKADQRRKFASLPPKLRQKGSFGNDLTTGSLLSKSILESSWSITASKGSIVLFDTKGVHRGGMVREGERLVLTCVIG